MRDGTLKINSNNILKVLVAITPEEQERGLMWVKWPPPIMTFPYKDSFVRKFWMKNTYCPLDIIFCNEGKIISIKHGEPLSTALIGPNTPSNLIIELPAGLAQNLNLKTGDTVLHQLTPIEE